MIWTDRRIYFLSLIVLLSALAVMITGCSSNTNSDMVSMYELQKTALASDDTLPEMQTVNSSAENAGDLFSYISDISYDKVEGYFLAYSSKGLADEIAVVCVREASDAEEMVKSLKAHVDSRVKMYSTYDPSQVDRASSALVFSDGRYAILIISDKQDAVKSAILEQIK